MSEKIPLEKVASELNKRFGDGSVIRLDEGADMSIAKISTGSLTLDIALGGGIARGRIAEIYGPESSGKSTLALHILAEAQKLGGSGVFIDMEHALDLGYAQKVGVDIHKMYLSQPDTGEHALEICESFVRSGSTDVVVVDSVAALVPQKELEGDVGDAVMGMQARMMSQALRKLSGAVKKTDTCVIFINQLRMKIGVMFGSPETTSGGMALKFYTSQRMDIRRIQSIKSGSDIVGGRARVRVVKNKVAPPFKTAEFDIMYGVGISRAGEILDLGVAAGIIDQKGAFYYYLGDRIGQGKENVKTYLNENQEFANEIANKIMDGINGKETPPPEEAA